MALLAHEFDEDLFLACHFRPSAWHACEVQQLLMGLVHDLQIVAGQADGAGARR